MSGEGHSAEDWVPVYEEPLHRVQWQNDYALVYKVDIPCDTLTLWHRHCEDTVYIAIGDVAVAESLPGSSPVVRQSPCGAAISRAHKAEPLVHQIRNVGTDHVRFFAAEARARPPGESRAPLALAGHTFEWEAERFRVYRLDDAAASDGRYEFHGLIVALAPMSVEITDTAGAVTHHDLAMGDWRWLTPPVTCRHAPGARGVIIEWR